VGTGAKIAIGCGVALVVQASSVLRSSSAERTGPRASSRGSRGQKQIDEFQRKADANPFARPADGRIQEAGS